MNHQDYNNMNTMHLQAPASVLNYPYQQQQQRFPQQQSPQTMNPPMLQSKECLGSYSLESLLRTCENLGKEEAMQQSSSSTVKITTDENSTSSGRDESKCPYDDMTEAEAFDVLRGKIQRDTAHCHLWMFLFDLMMDSAKRHIATWEDHKGMFCIKDPAMLAFLWGQKRKRVNMTYAKLSRSLRHYYEKKILKKVPKRKYTYKFNSKEILKSYDIQHFFKNLSPTQLRSRGKRVNQMPSNVPATPQRHPVYYNSPQTTFWISQPQHHHPSVQQQQQVQNGYNSWSPCDSSASMTPTSTPNHASPYHTRPNGWPRSGSGSSVPSSPANGPTYHPLTNANPNQVQEWVPPVMQCYPKAEPVQTGHCMMNVAHQPNTPNLNCNNNNSSDNSSSNNSEAPDEMLTDLLDILLTDDVFDQTAQQNGQTVPKLNLPTKLEPQVPWGGNHQCNSRGTSESSHPSDCSPAQSPHEDMFTDIIDSFGIKAF